MTETSTIDGSAVGMACGSIAAAVVKVGTAAAAAGGSTFSLGAAFIRAAAIISSRDGGFTTGTALMSRTILGVNLIEFQQTVQHDFQHSV